MLFSILEKILLVALVITVSAKAESLRDRFVNAYKNHAIGNTDSRRNSIGPSDGARHPSLPQHPNLTSPEQILKNEADAVGRLSDDTPVSIFPIIGWNGDSPVWSKYPTQTVPLKRLFGDFVPKTRDDEPYGRGGFGFQRGYPEGLVSLGGPTEKPYAAYYLRPAPKQKPVRIDPDMQVLVRGSGAVAHEDGAKQMRFGDVFPDYDPRTGLFRRGVPDNLSYYKDPKSRSGISGVWDPTIEGPTHSESVVIQKQLHREAPPRKTIYFHFSGGFGSDKSNAGQALFESIKNSLAKTCADPLVHCIVYITNFVTDPKLAANIANGVSTTPKVIVQSLDFDRWEPNHPPTLRQHGSMSMGRYIEGWKQQIEKKPEAKAVVYGHSWGGGLCFYLMKALADLCAKNDSHCDHLLKATLIDPVDPRLTNPITLANEMGRHAPGLVSLINAAKAGDKWEMLRLAPHAKSQLSQIVVNVFNGAHGPHNAGILQQDVHSIQKMFEKSKQDPAKIVDVDWQNDFKGLYSHKLVGFNNHYFKPARPLTQLEITRAIDRLSTPLAPQAVDALLTVFERNFHSALPFESSVVQSASADLEATLSQYTQQLRPPSY